MPEMHQIKLVSLHVISNLCKIQFDAALLQCARTFELIFQFQHVIPRSIILVSIISTIK